MKRLLDGRRTVCEISLANVDLADNLQIDVKQRRFDGTAANAAREQLLPLKFSIQHLNIVRRISKGHAGDNDN